LRFFPFRVYPSEVVCCEPRSSKFAESMRCFGSNGVGVYEKEIVAGEVTVLLPTKCEVMQVISVGACEVMMNNVTSI
jgi:hypothetical protein